jgi:Capsule polysaccharide biosynthesis protein
MREFFRQHIQRRLARHINNARIVLMALRVARLAPQPGDQRPIAFFKASSGLDDLSWNSAFHLLASWGLRMQGRPVVYFACDHGMSRCVLGSDRDDPSKTPPCRSCVYQSRTLYTGAQVNWFGFDRSALLAAALENLSLAELMVFEYENLPLGALVLPGLRWILRRYHLNDDDATRFFLREYILSAWNVAVKFKAFLDSVQPQAVVIFNGQFYPEAAAKWVAKQRGLRVISHEVGLQPATAFFTDGEATIYPIHIPADFEMDQAQNYRLDAYLQNRFQGNFSMAGVKFWPSIRALDAAFNLKAAQFKQIVPVFTNVIFDTSQPHANTVFTDMFGWLDLLLESAGHHPETLFVIRAHPDETRVRKSGLETVAGWVENRRVAELPNVLFVPPQERLSSYELISRSKFVTIYNSTIGLEAAILGAAVLCAGKARFTQVPTVFFPQTPSEYAGMLEGFLAADTIDVPAEFRYNGRRFLYYQLFRSSLPFGDFLETGVRTTHARLKVFDPRLLLNSPAIQTITKGLFEHGDFLLDENSL